MKNRKINTKRITAFMLSLLLILQQSFTYQVLASTITNGDGSAISGQNGVYNVRPDAVNGTTGFKEFGKIDLSQGDVLNLIYDYIKQNENITWNGTAHNVDVETSFGDINTFVSLVKQGVNIQGLVNTLQSVNGAVKTNSNLVFITPGGMVVGASGVINAGNLSVVTPTKTSYDKLSEYLNLPQKQAFYSNSTTINHDQSETDYEVVRDYDYTTNLAVDTNKTFNIVNMTDGNGQTLSIGNGDAQKIQIDGKVLARGNVDFQGGKVTTGNAA